MEACVKLQAINYAFHTGTSSVFTMPDEAEKYCQEYFQATLAIFSTESGTFKFQIASFKVFFFNALGIDAVETNKYIKRNYSYMLLINKSR